MTQPTTPRAHCEVRKLKTGEYCLNPLVTVVPLPGTTGNGIFVCAEHAQWLTPTGENR